MHTNRSLKARRVRVVREEGKTGLYYATSPDLKGLLCAETSLDELERAIPVAIRALYQACGEEVVVTPLQDVDESDSVHSWVAFPTAIADKERAERANA